MLNTITLILAKVLTKENARNSPGKMMPKHGHEGLEATMVFHGGYSDESGDYNKGDLVILEDNEEHTPISSEKTGCICLSCLQWFTKI